MLHVDEDPRIRLLVAAGGKKFRPYWRKAEHVNTRCNDYLHATKVLQIYTLLEHNNPSLLERTVTG